MRGVAAGTLPCLASTRSTWDRRPEPPTFTTSASCAPCCNRGPIPGDGSPSHHGSEAAGSCPQATPSLSVDERCGAAMNGTENRDRCEDRCPLGHLWDSLDRHRHRAGVSTGSPTRGESRPRGHGPLITLLTAVPLVQGVGQPGGWPHGCRYPRSRIRRTDPRTPPRRRGRPWRQ